MLIGTGRQTALRDRIPRTPRTFPFNLLSRYAFSHDSSRRAMLTIDICTASET